ERLFRKQQPRRAAEVNVLFGASYHGSAFQVCVLKVFGFHSRFAISLRRSETSRVGQIAVREHAAVVINLELRAGMIDWIICQTFQITDVRERLHFGTAATNGHCRKSIWSNYQNGLDLALTERQQIILVLQQGYAFTRGTECNLAALRVKSRNRQRGLIMIEPAEAYRRSQYATHFVVDSSEGDFALFNRGLERLKIHVQARRHFE